VRNMWEGREGEGKEGEEREREREREKTGTVFILEPGSCLTVARQLLGGA